MGLAATYAIIPVNLIAEGKVMTSIPETAGGYVVLTGYAEAEDDGFNAYCPELGVASCGDTVEEVLDNLGDALELQLLELADIGRLERDFREKGVTVKAGPLPDESVIVEAPVGKTMRVYVLPVPAPVPVPAAV